jgi:ATP-dependent Clp protease ATP-binding subunit ClpC
MYERFSPGARKAMQLANQEAMRYRHNYIGTEHILLGIITEDTGVAAVVLNDLGIDLSRIRLEVEKIVLSGGHAADKLPIPRAKKVIEYSIAEARDLNHDYIGTEHLLLSLLREEDGVAAQVLVGLGLGLDVVREKILEVLGHDKSTDKGGPSVVVEVPGTIPVEVSSHPLVAQLMKTIDEFNRQKEWCVAKQQFEEAAVLRDRCDEIRKNLRQIVDLLRRNPNLGMTQKDDLPGTP